MAAAEVTEGARLAVWGDPISHSRSPQLHAAAYRVLGLDWSYERRRVDAAGFDAALAGLDDAWRGLSLTMPLKEPAFRAAAVRDRHAALTGVVNTLLLGEVVRGFNTDVGGLVDALREGGLGAVGSARLLGAGATAASALVAVAELGARRAEVRARRPESAAQLVSIGRDLGIEVTVHPLRASADAAEVTISTLPSGTVLDDAIVRPLAETGGALLDAAYAPWPSALAAVWPHETVLSGFEMLLRQAVRQIRIFVGGDQDEPLPGEGVMVSEMRGAVVGD